MRFWRIGKQISSSAFGGSAESWPIRQAQYDLAQVKAAPDQGQAIDPDEGVSAAAMIRRKSFIMTMR